MGLETRIVVGVVAAITIAAIAWRAHSLSRSGAAAAAVVGTVAAAAGWSWAALLITYFVSSTLLSRWGKARKSALTGGMVEKPGARDAMQVLSNGLTFSIAALLAAVDAERASMLMAAGAGSLAASAADTWATEVGTLVGHRPHSIVTGRPLEVGQSGGVTLPGSLASVAGAAFVALTALGVGWPSRLVAAVVVGGLAGSVADSLAGALIQRRSWCDACGVPTEMRIHSCGTTTRRAGGIAFVGNDLVNLAATIVGAAVSVMLL